MQGAQRQEQGPAQQVWGLHGLLVGRTGEEGAEDQVLCCPGDASLESGLPSGSGSHGGGFSASCSDQLQS